MAGSLRKITKDRIAVVRQEWEQVSDPDLFAVEYQDVLDRMAHDAESPTQLDAHYEMVADTGVSLALLEMIDSQQGKQTKLLRYYFSPDQLTRSLEGPESEFTREATDTFVEVINAVVLDSLMREIRDIKIYGRSDEMLSVLESLKRAVDNSDFSDNGVTIKAMFEGRWLRVLFNSSPRA